MGLMDKIKSTLIVEDTSNISVGPAGRVSITESIPDYVPSLEVDTSNVLSIDTIYASAGLSNTEKSVYKVEEIKNTLGSLPKEAMKAATLGMMGVVKLTTEEVQADTESRSEVLAQALTQFTQKTAEIKSDMEITIAEMEEKIDTCKKFLAERELDQEKQQGLITVELEKIKAIKDFII